jgi:hypothetical protein
MKTLLEQAAARRWRVQDDGSRDGDASAEVLCRRGLLYPYQPAPGQPETRFVAFTAASTAIRAALLAVPGAQREQGSPVQREGSELAVSYPLAALDAVAAILKPKRLGGRAATAEDRERLSRTGFARTSGALEEPRSPRAADSGPLAPGSGGQA